MDTEAYNAWMSLYDRSVECAWYSQCTELRNTAMLLKVLDNEFKRVYENAKEKFTFWENMINTNTEIVFKKELIDEKERYPKPCTVSNLEYVIDGKENTTFNHCIVNSPEVFGHANLSNSLSNNTATKDNTVLTPPQEKYCTSPKINRTIRISKLKRLKQDGSANNSSLKTNHIIKKSKQQMTDIIDSSIIETTPKANKHKSISTNKSKSKAACSTLTQMFHDSLYSTKDVDNKSSAHANNEENQLMKNKSKQFETWNCSDCKAFYDALDLNTPNTLLKQCSKHKNKNELHNYTPKGFWDLNFPLTPPSKRSPSKSTYFQY